MPKLLFEPKSHRVGEDAMTYITSSNKGDPVICIRCNDVAQFIIEKMHPDHIPRTSIIPLVKDRFGCSYEEAAEAVETVILKLEGMEISDE